MKKQNTTVGKVNFFLFQKVPPEKGVFIPKTFASPVEAIYQFPNTVCLQSHRDLHIYLEIPLLSPGNISFSLLKCHLLREAILKHITYHNAIILFEYGMLTTLHKHMPRARTTLTLTQISSASQANIYFPTIAWLAGKITEKITEQLEKIVRKALQIGWKI